jgi:hypothetical protein
MVEWYWQRKLKNSEKKPVAEPLCAPQITQIEPGTNLDLLSERPVTNRLSHGTAYE